MVANAAATVLVADDQPAVIIALRLVLENAGFAVDSAGSVDDIRARLSTRPYDLLLMDLNYARDTTSGREGLDLIEEVRERDRLLPIVAMTGWSTVDTAVEAMRRGVRAFVSKPWDNAALTETIRREVEEGMASRRTNASLTRELDEARLVQRALLPATLPEAPACRMAAIWEPAAVFGGDCYDAFRLDDHRVAFSIGDVCGKGLPAALLMSSLQASVRSLAEPDRPPREVVSRVNQVLCRHRGLGRFVTFFYGVFDSSTGLVTICNAGHVAPVLVHPGGAVKRLSADGPVLGVFEDARYDQREASLAPGDRLVLFTDGITEAQRPDGEDLGDDRLVDLVVRDRHAAPAALLSSMLASVRAFATDGLQDDATLLALGIGST